MKIKYFSSHTHFLFLIFVWLIMIRCYGALTLFNSESSQLITKLEEVYLDNIAYFSVDDFANKNQIRVYENMPLGKKVLYFSKKSLKITANSPFLSFGNRIVKMSHSAVIVDGNLYVPVYSFLNILHDELYPKISYSIEPDKYRKILVLKSEDKETRYRQKKEEPKAQLPPGYQVKLKSIKYEKKNNGLVIRI